MGRRSTDLWRQPLSDPRRRDLFCTGEGFLKWILGFGFWILDCNPKSQIGNPKWGGLPDGDRSLASRRAGVRACQPLHALAGQSLRRRAVWGVAAGGERPDLGDQ